MSYTPSFKSGDWKVTCDVCGRIYKASEVKQRWDGLIVCPEDFEIRHSLDFIKVKPEKISVPFSRPEPTDQFVTFCTIVTRQARAGLGVAGCMISGFTPIVPDDNIPSGTFNNSL